jgi:hypothetical protein
MIMQGLKGLGFADEQIPAEVAEADPGAAKLHKLKLLVVPSFALVASVASCP